MKKLLTVIILLVLAGGGWYAYGKYGKTEEKPQVVQQTLQTGNIVQAVQATGTLESLRNVAVGSQVSGVVKALYADFNSIVHKDQIIAEIDPSLLQVQVEIQKANIARQEGDIEQLKVQLENDQTNLRRAEAQAKAGLITQQALEAAQLQVKSRQAQIASSEKQLFQSRANLGQAELNVSYCTIRSPVDGVVVDRRVDVGVTVQASMTTPQFFTIATDLTTLKLSAGVDEADIGYLRRGMPVQFTVESYPQTTFEGTVDAVRLNATTQNNVVTYPVWINVENNDLRLKPSMTATVRIIVDQANNVLRIPNQATRFRPTSDTYAWLGMTPPAAGRGRAGMNAEGGGRGGAEKGAQGAPAKEGAVAGSTPAAPGAGMQADASQQGQGERRGGRRGNGGGQFGQGGGENAQGGQNAQMGGGQAQGGNNGGFGRGRNLTPEQIAEMQARFGGQGGRGGRGGRGGQFGQGGQGGGRFGQGGQGGQLAQGGGRGRGAGQQAANGQTGNTTPLAQRNADKIDDLFTPVPKRLSQAQVWVYDEKATDPNRKLRSVSVTLGLTDGQFSELVRSGEPLQAGSQVVTAIIPPASAQPKAGSSNIFQPGRGGGGGFPGGGGGFPGGGGGAPRGGGGGGRGGD